MSSERRVTAGSRQGSSLAVPVFFLILAAILWSPPWGYKPEDHPAHVSAPTCETPPFPREAKKGPVIEIDGAEYNCSDCHADGDTVPEAVKLPLASEHTHIRLNHGRNDHCFNCHHPESRDFLTSYRGRQVPFTEVSKTCGNCHVTIFLDWEKNIHGRHTGMRDDIGGTHQVAGCTSCHDPHSPKFKPIAPCPPPAIPAHVRGDRHGPTPERS